MNTSNITGIILFGGNGTRLKPLTTVVNKHLLPIYNKTLAQHAAEFFLECGITQLIFSVNSADLPIFEIALASELKGKATYSFVVQQNAGGTAKAISDCLPHIKTEYVATLWGDNLFEHEQKESCINFVNQSNFKCKLHTTIVDNPTHFGVVEVDQHEKVLAIENKPKYPISNTICTGFMLYETSFLISHINTVKMNRKGELDIMDVVSSFAIDGLLEAKMIDGWWMDAGTSHDSLLSAAIKVKKSGINKSNPNNKSKGDYKK